MFCWLILLLIVEVLLCLPAFAVAAVVAAVAVAQVAAGAVAQVAALNVPILLVIPMAVLYIWRAKPQKCRTMFIKMTLQYSKYECESTIEVGLNNLRHPQPFFLCGLLILIIWWGLSDACRGGVRDTTYTTYRRIWIPLKTSIKWLNVWTRLCLIGIYLKYNSSTLVFIATI